MRDAMCFSFMVGTVILLQASRICNTARKQVLCMYQRYELAGFATLLRKITNEKLDYVCTMGFWSCSSALVPYLVI